MSFGQPDHKIATKEKENWQFKTKQTTVKFVSIQRYRVSLYNAIRCLTKVYVL